MIRYLPATQQCARKTYTCNASEWLSNLSRSDLLEYNFSYVELREIVKARRNDWQIKPGQEYIRQVVFDDGYGGPPYVWRGIPAIDAICKKYDIYDYWLA